MKVIICDNCNRTLGENEQYNDGTDGERELQICLECVIQQTCIERNKLNRKISTLKKSTLEN